MLKKVLPIIPLLFLTASASASVVTLPDGSKACPLPCAVTMTLPDGSHVCPFRVPKSIDVEIFVVELSGGGHAMAQTMRPNDVKTGPFALPSSSLMTKEKVKQFGLIRLHSIANIKNGESAVIPFSDGNVPVLVGDAQIGELASGAYAKIFMTNGECSSADVTANIIVSESAAKSGIIPQLNIFSVKQSQEISFGNSLIIGGFQRVAGDADKEYIAFINVTDGE